VFCNSMNQESENAYSDSIGALLHSKLNSARLNRGKHVEDEDREWKTRVL